jgi:hypothetical protein
MMEPKTLRRPVMHFDVGVGVSHVTFDDGKVLGRSLPWGDFVEARREHARPEVIEVEIGGWRVEIRGHNLEPLFASIEERTLLRVRAQPDLETNDLKPDTYVTEILFSKPAVAPVRRRHGQLEIDLGV